MDIIEFIRDIGSLNDKEFKDCLIKKIPMEFYYVLDIRMDNGFYKVDVLKREGSPVEIPNRIRLYEYGVNNTSGLSVSVFSLSNKKSLYKYLTKLRDFLDLDFLNDMSLDNLFYVDNKEEFEDLYGLSFRGYITVAFEGRLLVDIIDNYDSIMVEEIYLNNTYEGNGNCYLCEDDNNLIYGGIKEPGIKFLSVTRVNEISNNKKEVFIRCNKCEIDLIKGFDLLNSISVKSRRDKDEIESMLIPVIKDKRIFNQMKKLRSEHSSELRYYESLSRLFSRYSRRGLNLIIELVLSRRMKYVTIISMDILQVKDLDRLYLKKRYEVFLENNGLKDVDKDFPYYPEKVLSSDSDLKWKFIEKIKRYWIGKENASIWNLIGKIEKLSKKEIILYKMFNDYVKVGDNLIDNVKTDKFYWLGRLVKEVIRLESLVPMESEDKVINRFMVYNKNYDYILKECESVVLYLNNFDFLDLSQVNFILDNVNKKEYFNEEYYILGRFERRLNNE